MTHRWLNYTMAIMKKSFESVVIFKQFLLTHNSLNLMWQVTTITLHITSITTYLFYNKCLAWMISSELCYIPLSISNILLWMRQDKILMASWNNNCRVCHESYKWTFLTGKYKYFEWVFITKRTRNAKKYITARKYVTRQINWIHKIQF